MRAPHHLIVNRQDGPALPARRQRVDVPPGARTLAEALVPGTDSNAPGPPVEFPDDCVGQPACGACVVLVDGVPRPLCTTPVSSVRDGAILTPLARFPLIRDLRVDTTPVLGALLSLQAWAPLDDLGVAAGPTPRESADRAHARQQAGGCTWCGACLEVCPSALGRSGFAGALAVLESALHLAHPNVHASSSVRLGLLGSRVGVDGCGQHGACQAHCPAALPLTSALAQVGRGVRVGQSQAASAPWEW